MDIIFIKGLEIDTVIGIYDWERQIKQTVVLDLEMAYDIKQATQTDDIKHTLDYKAVAKRLIDFVSNSKFHLIETLAEQIAQIVLTEFDISRLTLTVNKGKAVTGASGVGVVITRQTQ